MKKYVIILLFILNLLLIGFYIGLKSKYNELNIDLNKLLGDGVSYEEQINIYNEDYNELINKISLLSGKEFLTYDEVKRYEEELIVKHDELKNENEELITTIDSLKEQKNVLQSTYNKLYKEEMAKRTYLINNISKINQYSVGYPTGCESAALTILLNYWGVNVSIGQVVDVLPKGDQPYYENNIRYGGNPYIEFIGHPRNSYSYGVYDIPIQNVANTFKEGIINGRGMSMNDVLAIVRQGRPVIVWNSMNLSVPHISNSWIYKPTGETIKWLADLHALVVVGYNDNQIITSDSLTGTIRYFDRKTFESRYNAFGKRALYY